MCGRIASRFEKACSEYSSYDAPHLADIHQRKSREVRRGQTDDHMDPLNLAQVGPVTDDEFVCGQQHLEVTRA